MITVVYQIKYSNNVAGEFDPAFIPYDCRDNPEPEKREIVHMLRFYDQGIWRHQGVNNFGLVSPKFTAKTRISGTAFIDWVNANPGYDVYFINPFPQLSYWYFNVWTQGEFWHPGLTELANALFSVAGLSIQIENLSRNNAATLLYSNYWIGSQKFWSIYMSFVRKLVRAADDLDAGTRKKLFELAPHYAPATYYPFVFERLFSTFLVLNGNIACLPYQYTCDEIIDRCDNDMERFVIREWFEIIDTWDASNRDDTEYRKIFANLQGMIWLHRQIAPYEAGSDSSIWKELVDKLRRMIELVRAR